MKNFTLSVNAYRNKLEEVFGFADPEMVQRYADARVEQKRAKIMNKEDFDPFTDDPNCKTCKKLRRK